TAIAPIERDAVANATGSQVIVGIRPEDVIISTSGPGITVEVDVVEELGADGYLYGHAEVEGQRVDVIARVDGRNHPNAGDRVIVNPVPQHIHTFDVASGNRLNDAIVA